MASVVAFNQASVSKMGTPVPSPTCPICLGLMPNHLPTTPWQFNVTENMLLESRLPFKVSDIERSGKNCDLCSIIWQGLETLSRGVLQHDLIGLRSRIGSLVVQKNLPLEVEIFSANGPSDKTSRAQFFKQAGKHSDFRTQIGN